MSKIKSMGFVPATQELADWIDAETKRRDLSRSATLNALLQEAKDGDQLLEVHMVTSGIRTRGNSGRECEDCDGNGQCLVMTEGDDKMHHETCETCGGNGWVG
jgi:hypothetical protein